MRELVPEFFYMPEMFLNLNKINMGKNMDGRSVESVKIPEWANGDPLKYVCMLREYLESDYVSNHIHQWVDYIFGYKQKGKEAEDAVNIFPKITYENGVDIKKIAPEM